MEMKFYRCRHCGQIVAVVKSTGVPLVCCGEEKCEGVLEGSRRNVKENMQNSVDLPQSWTQGPPGKSHSHPHWPP